MKWIRLASLVWLFAGTACESVMTAEDNTELPVRTVRVTMTDGALQEFVEQVRKFADANAFALRTGQTSPDPEHILVQLWREDIKGIGVNTSESEAADLTYTIFLYRNSNDAVPESAFDDLILRTWPEIGG